MGTLYDTDTQLYNKRSLKSQVGLLQTAHSWANAGVVLGGRVRRGEEVRNN